MKHASQHKQGHKSWFLHHHHEKFNMKVAGECMRQFTLLAGWLPLSGRAWMAKYFPHALMHGCISLCGFDRSSSSAVGDVDPRSNVFYAKPHTSHHREEIRRIGRVPSASSVIRTIFSFGSSCFLP